MNKPKILIVEDEEAVQQVLSQKLIQSGFDVIQAFDGEHGLKSALDNHPNLILLDLVMPKLDGWSLLKKIRTDPWGKDVCIMVLTNLGNVDARHNYDDLNVQDYLIKTDWTLDSLVERVRTCLKPHP